MAAEQEARDQRRRLDDLERRVLRLELSTIKRDGPLVQQLQEATDNVRELRREITSKAELDRALRRQTDEIERKRQEGRREAAGERERIFSKREKLAALLIASAVLGIQVVSLILHAAGVA